MKIEQIYTSCIAEAAYYIESEGEVAIIDPLRNPAPYLERAKKDGAKIKYIFETHSMQTLYRDILTCPKRQEHLLFMDLRRQQVLIFMWEKMERISN